MAAWRGEFGSAEDYNSKCRVGDVNRNHAYFGFNVHPYETLFVKSNRDIEPVMIDKLTAWHDNMNITSWEACDGRRD